MSEMRKRLRAMQDAHTHTCGAIDRLGVALGDLSVAAGQQGLPSAFVELIGSRIDRVQGALDGVRQLEQLLGDEEDVLLSAAKAVDAELASERVARSTCRKWEELVSRVSEAQAQDSQGGGA